MKTLLAMMMLLAIAIQSNAQILKSSGLGDLLKRSSTDPVLKVERQAALEFHEIINEYRVENGLEELLWCDTFWLVSRNHCIWMAENGTLTHNQTEATKFFTGVSPGSRHVWARNPNTHASWSGENALYNWTASGENNGEKARAMAQYSFNQWKSSPGHDQNMRSRAKIHGVAFIMDGQQTWATDLFGHDWTRTEPRRLAMADNRRTPSHAPSPTKTKVEKKTPPKPRITRSMLADMHMELTLAFNDSLKSHPAQANLLKASEAHAKYLSYAREISSIENKRRAYYYGKSPYRRLLKASKGLAIFNSSPKKVNEVIVSTEITISHTFSLQEVRMELEKQLADQAKEGESAMAAAYGIAVRKRAGKLKFYVVKMSKLA